MHELQMHEAGSSAEELEEDGEEEWFETDNEEDSEAEAVMDNFAAYMDQFASSDEEDESDEDSEVEEEEIEIELDDAMFIPCDRNTKINWVDIDRKIQELVNSTESTGVAIQPLPKPSRKILHQLVTAYGLKSKTEGKGRARFTIIQSNRNAKKPDFANVQRILTKAMASEKEWQNRLSTKKNNNNESRSPRSNSNNNSPRSRKTKRDLPQRNNNVNRKGRGRKTQGFGGNDSRANSSSSNSAAIKPGHVVGSNAEPIADDNIGNRLLRKMGWNPGEGIGNAGITVPVEAIVRKKQSGLGSK